MLETYRPEFFPEVKAFCRRLKNFFYVRLIIKAHSSGRLPGECYVWREDGSIVAFSAVAYLNPDDAWLWGMRVATEFQSKGIATRFTRALFPIVRKTGRTWAGLNTLDHAKPAPTFRVMDKLGFRVEDIYADDVYWRLPKGVPRPHLEAHRDIFAHFARLGRKTIFHQRPGWFCSRLTPARRQWVNKNGYRLDGVPVHVVRRRYVEKGPRYTLVTVNLFDRPADFVTFVPRLLALVPGRGHLVVNYPAEWKRDFRAAARAVIPKMKKNRGYWPSAWRIYGKPLA